MDQRVNPKAKVLEPLRTQGTFQFVIPDDVLAADHPARLLWDVFGRVDLTRFSVGKHSVEGKAGRPLLSPRQTRRSCGSWAI